MLVGSVPFKEASLEDGGYAKFLEQKDFDNEGLNLARNMMSLKPRERPTLQEIM